MHDKNNQPVSGQVSLFQILKLLDDRENALSSRDLSKIIDKLSSVKYKQEIYEAKNDKRKNAKYKSPGSKKKHILRKQQVWNFPLIGKMFLIMIPERRGFTQTAFRTVLYTAYLSKTYFKLG